MSDFVAEIEEKYQENEIEKMGSYNHSLVQARIAGLLLNTKNYLAEKIMGECRTVRYDYSKLICCGRSLL